MTDEEIINAMVEVQNLAVKRGLHGVMLLSPKCEHCGCCHQFKMLTDLNGDEPQGLLAYYAEVAKGPPNTIIDLQHKVN